MLKVNSGDTPNLIIDISGDSDTTQKMDIYTGYLKDAIVNSINPIFDNEITEFKPEQKSLNFYLFFSAFENTETLSQIKPYCEDLFEFYLNDTLKSLVNGAKTTITEPKTILQAINIPAPKSFFNYHKQAHTIYEERPYVVQDPVQSIINVLPTKEGIPIFYNSFTIPFSKNIPKWGNDNLGFSNKTFLYNSFLLMDFYTTNNPLTQKKIMSTPIYVNGRYMGYEHSVSNTKQVRPSFYLDNTSEGFSIIWLKKYKIDKLYVKFSFWDALNGLQIQLIPSSESSTTKKWVQNANTFKQDNLYLEYDFNYVNKSYKIKEFNDVSGLYDKQTTNLDFYQLVYDEYFAKLKPIMNVRPFRDDLNTDEPLVDNIILGMSKVSLNDEVETTFNDAEPIIKHINKHYFLGIDLPIFHLFDTGKVPVKDRALSFFEARFGVDGLYSHDLGDIILTNTTETGLLVKKISISNIKIVNKNSFIEGNVLVYNKFTKTPVNISPSKYICDTLFTYPGSSFYMRADPIRQPYNDLQTSLYNKQAEMYSSFYYDETNNKVVAKPKQDISTILSKIAVPKKINFIESLFMGGSAKYKIAEANKYYNVAVKGLTLSDKDVNILLRSEVLEKGGTTNKYNLLFPASLEKLAHKTDEYRDFGVSIRTTLSPQYPDFDKKLSITLNTSLQFGKEFFKLFIATNDNITITYNIEINFVDTADKPYKKIIPCSLKYT